MNPHYSKFIITVLCLFHLTGYAQVQIQSISPHLTSENGDTLRYAFSGGLNSGQFSEVDIDGDGDFDLVIFDRGADIFLGFENSDDHYVYHPEYAYLFPDGLEHWVVFADYNCDGVKDLFTQGDQGINVYQRNGYLDDMTWQLVADPLFTEGISGEINALLNATDLPAVLDIDEDGDIDLLYFNFANGDLLEFHKNYAMERSGICGLDMVRESQQFGDFEMCDCDEFGFEGEECHANTRLAHLLGKTILLYDQNEDGLLDLVLGQETCENLNLLLNSGTAVEATFDSSDSAFPSLRNELGLTGFPAAYHLDLNFDGMKDIMVTQNLREGDDSGVNFEESTWLHEGTGSGGYDEGYIFLQDEMIDVGEAAYPTFADIDGDGLDDLIIGGLASSKMGLAHLRQANGGFVYESDDEFGLSSLGFNKMVPQFFDLNNDGHLDLILLVTENNQTTLNYWLNKAEAGIDIDLSERHPINIALSATDDYYFYDWDDDGLVDVLVGSSFGELAFYRNMGPELNLILSNNDLLESTTTANNLNVSLTVGDIDENGLDDLVVTRRAGNAFICSDFTTSPLVLTELQINEEGDGRSTRWGRRSKPAIGTVNGKKIIAVGTLLGGVQLFEVVSTSEESLSLEIYPNPSLDGFFNIQSNHSGVRCKVFDLSGNQVVDTFVMESNVSLDISSLGPGIYILRAEKGNRRTSRRLILY